MTISVDSGTIDANGNITWNTGGNGYTISGGGSFGNTLNITGINYVKNSDGTYTATVNLGGGRGYTLKPNGDGTFTATVEDSSGLNITNYMISIDPGLLTALLPVTNLTEETNAVIESAAEAAVTQTESDMSNVRVMTYVQTGTYFDMDHNTIILEKNDDQTRAAGNDGTEHIVINIDTGEGIFEMLDNAAALESEDEDESGDVNLANEMAAALDMVVEDVDELSAETENTADTSTANGNEISSSENSDGEISSDDEEGNDEEKRLNGKNKRGKNPPPGQMKRGDKNPPPGQMNRRIWHRATRLPNSPISSKNRRWHQT